MPICQHCKAESAEAHYDRVVHNLTALHGPWSGWRMAGRHLISPDGDRIKPERVRDYWFGSNWKLAAIALEQPCREVPKTSYVQS